MHRVLPGNHLGQNDGRVTEIERREDHVVEIVPDGLGGYMERPAALALERMICRRSRWLNNRSTVYNIDTTRGIARGSAARGVLAVAAWLAARRVRAGHG